LASPSNGGPWKLIGTTPNGIGVIPIVEYAMPELMGVFEKAIPLMDALNTAASNRVDDLEQFIQSILWICGVDLDEDAREDLQKNLCLITPNVQEGAQPQVKFLVNNLDQNGIQGMVDDLYYHILEVCSCPGREQSSGGNTGAATELGAGGWRKAQYSAERIISAWQKGDREMYRIALAILEKSRKTPAELRNLKPTDLETKFTLSKNNDLLTKTQGILNLMQAGVHPRIAYREVGVFSDPEQVYEESKETADKAMEKMHGSDDKSLGAVDVTNQPRSTDSLEQNVTGKGSIQKRD
jgi:SPP1 family phage portal protein